MNGGPRGLFTDLKRRHLSKSANHKRGSRSNRWGFAGDPKRDQDERLRQRAASTLSRRASSTTSMTPASRRSTRSHCGLRHRDFRPGRSKGRTRSNLSASSCFSEPAPLLQRAVVRLASTSRLSQPLPNADLASGRHHRALVRTPSWRARSFRSPGNGLSVTNQHSTAGSRRMS